MKGKEKCEFLKGIRKRMAEANGIQYEPRKCTYDGDCTGTCPFCEKEAADLMAELRKKEAQGVEIEKGVCCVLQLHEEQMKQFEDGNNHAQLIVTKYTPPGGVCNDPFNGQNNPFMSGKDLREMKQYIHRERESYMGDIPYPYFGISEEDKETKVLRQEEELRANRERKGKGVINRLIASIKRNTTIQGELDE